MTFLKSGSAKIGVLINLVFMRLKLCFASGVQTKVLFTHSVSGAIMVLKLQMNRL